METKISDYDSYVAGMKKSIKDKLFFEGLIDNDVDTFVDFGCADGQILAQIAADFPEWKLYGVDADEDMIRRASSVCNKAKFVKSLSLINEISEDKTILNLSSVIHEIYSYMKPDNIKALWDEIFRRGFRYISIRDLMIGSSVNSESDINDIRKVVRKGDYKQLLDFVNYWGDLRSKRSLIHFLMKYRYKANWDREVKENYFPITVEQFLNLIPDSYEIVYFNHYILPFTKDVIKRDFGINLCDNTHVKILLKSTRMY